MQEQQNTKQAQKTNNKKIRTRAILVLVVILILSIFVYISYRGNYLETIEIGEKFNKKYFTNTLQWV